MGFHFGVDRLQGGFFSLDIFYVLSGYLITGLLLGEWAGRPGSGSWAFWLRRARRLLPALLVVLVVVTLVIRFTYPAGLYPDLRMADLSALFYFSNWWQIAASRQLLRGHRGRLPPDPHLVAGRRGAVLPGVAAGGAGRVPPGPRFPTGAWSSCSRCRWSGGRPRPRRWPGSITPGSTPPGSTSAPTPTPSRSWSGPPPACVLTLVQRHRGRGHGPRGPLGPLPGWASPGSAWPAWGHPGPHHKLHRHQAFAYRGGFLVSALSAAALIVGAVCVADGPIARGCRSGPWCGSAPSPTAPICGLPGVRRARCGPHRLGGLGSAGRWFAFTFALAATQLLPGRASGHEGRLAQRERGRPAALATGGHVAVVVAGR